MKKTMMATVLGLALMPLTFAAQTQSKPADKSATDTTSTDTTKAPVKKHKKHVKKPAAKTPANTNQAPAANPAPAPAQK